MISAPHKALLSSGSDSVGGIAVGQQSSSGNVLVNLSGPSFSASTTKSSSMRMKMASANGAPDQQQQQ
ncbi:hypothetical protein BV898_06336 [Hypsibius exemplaris]|uniref:Uncharacterized protein n=1 Tax=Hypsibius exemplaris TaxID=2072580 RepID=A0A1W0WWJ9_HYPEX|nr:hypothetical protein BV898_06336 [Hypsibius exemplaris]